MRAFADDMVRDHTAVNDKALALVKKLNVTPEDNDTSQALVKQADAERDEAGRAQRRGVRQGVRRQRGRLPQGRQRGARDDAHPLGAEPGTQGLLETGLKIFQGHEQHAEHLASTLK